MIGQSILAAVAFVLSPAPVSAQTTVAAPAPATAPAEDAKICRREKVTGSKARSRRICMTKAQWNELWSRTRESNSEIDSRYGRGLCLNSAASGAC